MIIGPNTGLGHNSMILMIEAQVTYILQALEQMRSRWIETLEVRPEVESRYNERLQQQLQRAIWSTGGCRSWYLDPHTGKNTTLWPGSTWRFRQVTHHFQLSDYKVSARISPRTEPAPAQAQSPGGRP